MDRDGSTVYPSVRVLYNSNCTVWDCFVIIELLRIYTALFLSLPLINKALLFLYSSPGWIPCIRLSRFYALFVIYSYRSAFLLFVFDMQCSKITRQNKPGPLMPRRPPPTPLLLVQGPLPPRGESKFTMPSLPRPIFHPPTATAVVRRRVSCDPIEGGMMRGVKRGELAAPSRTVSR